MIYGWHPLKNRNKNIKVSQVLVKFKEPQTRPTKH